MIVATAVVVVNRPPDPAVVYEEVLKDPVERRPCRRGPVSAGEHIRHSVPAVERPGEHAESDCVLHRELRVRVTRGRRFRARH